MCVDEEDEGYLVFFVRTRKVISNDEKLMKKMMYEQVDGLITDRVKLAKKTIKEFQDDSSYVNRILNYITVVHMPNDLEA
ncbi:glycerophosphoryl diester phosphodiesterase [Lactobacillus helveticus]|uniref:Glycerophosphoryl diester phosphodiesterase n=2 Tax=Lactobacillus helveticus TaxID=1587 RepID=U6FDA8_LACHE|nr:glycerophosphoryl diester phosphodiesterase [Lactobacillus helveticus]CDI61030.1 Glycerophosphoryl diester phosphodiesterase [Lactobacillus helveticus CIRM-BIA 104]CDI62311.1 Glycerophosphoryl diester phosphodiesterase [Lactobacillus helveticus CIRM-BIA 103]CDI64867.1 Glycerophosphoryl diester phosphodiesterase [Lactobacillus helveticus CIRM-BIA 101]